MKSNLILATAFFFAILISCGPKKGTVLRSPSQTTGHANGDVLEKSKQEDKEEKAIKNEESRHANNIALYLPFQLDKVSGTTVSEEDVKRSALSLDFYQGFQMGLNQVVNGKRSITLNVVDSRDNQAYAGSLGSSQTAQNANLIVGPVYPSEIKSFGSTRRDSTVLQVNPLAATMPTEFDQPNLVSTTPPISVHMRATAAELAKKYSEGDRIIIYNTTDNDHLLFINGFVADIKQRLPDANVISVTSNDQLNKSLTDSASNFIVTGTTNRTTLKSFLTNLDNLDLYGGYSIYIFGHPNWENIDFKTFPNFEQYHPVISTESHLDPDAGRTRSFQSAYKSEFGVLPSNHSYKGYDSGVYFGQLLDKYGRDYAKHITEESYNGIYSNYKFNKNSRWGYVNFGVSIKAYKFGKFQSL